MVCAAWMKPRDLSVNSLKSMSLFSFSKHSLAAHPHEACADRNLHIEMGKPRGRFKTAAAEKPRLPRAGLDAPRTRRDEGAETPPRRRPMTQADDRLIVALDLPDAHAGLQLAGTLGDAVSFYKIGLGMLTGGGLALANELKQEHGKRIFLDMKLFDIGATVEAAVRGLARFDLDFLTVHGDPHVVRAAAEGRGVAPTKLLAVTILTSLDRHDLDEALIRPGDIAEIVAERAARAL